MLKVLSAIWFVVFSFLFFPLTSLNVNIISHSLQNGAGKQVDVTILKGELERLGHRVNLCDYEKIHHIPSVDINIFLAQCVPSWFSKAKLNWFIPNPEHCHASLKDIKKFDLILCKTKECLRIFKRLNKNTYYLGFTSIDRHEPLIAKDFSKYIHVAGKSGTKGTVEVLQAWRNHLEFPDLILIKHTEINAQIPRNVKLIKERIPEASLIGLQNECGFHLCPSKTEGFGHYIMEGMAAEAVIISTNGPPMNEFIKDKRCLVKYKKKGQRKLGITYTIDEKHLASVIKALQKLPHEELRKIGQNNRQEYLRRTAEFKQNFENLINKTVTDLHN